MKNKYFSIVCVWPWILLKSVPLILFETNFLSHPWRWSTWIFQLPPQCEFQFD